MKEINEKWSMISKINKEFEDLYHKVALHYNLSDSSFWILYTLYENRQGCTQKQICSEWSFSKQTINSAIKDLIKKQYIVLDHENDNRKSKTVYLTSKGLDVAKNTVKKIIEIENTAFSKVDKKDYDFVINFFKVQLSSLKEEINKIL